MQPGRPRRRRVRRPRKPDTDAASADERTVRTAALALLAGRDFARRELTARLIRKGFPEPTVDAVVERLAAERLQDEGRFTEQFVDAAGRARPRAHPHPDGAARTRRSGFRGRRRARCERRRLGRSRPGATAAAVRRRAAAGFPRACKTGTIPAVSRVFRGADPRRPRPRGDPTAETAAEAAGPDDDLEP